MKLVHTQGGVLALEDTSTVLLKEAPGAADGMMGAFREANWGAELQGGCRCSSVGVGDLRQEAFPAVSTPARGAGACPASRVNRL